LSLFGNNKAQGVQTLEREDTGDVARADREVVDTEKEIEYFKSAISEHNSLVSLCDIPNLKVGVL